MKDALSTGGSLLPFPAYWLMLCPHSTLLGESPVGLGLVQSVMMGVGCHTVRAKTWRPAPLPGRGGRAAPEKAGKTWFIRRIRSAKTDLLPFGSSSRVLVENWVIIFRLAGILEGYLTFSKYWEVQIFKADKPSWEHSPHKKGYSLWGRHIRILFNFKWYLPIMALIMLIWSLMNVLPMTWGPSFSAVQDSSVGPSMLGGLGGPGRERCYAFGQRLPVG